MAVDIFTKTREGGVTIGISYYFILSLGVTLRFTLSGLIVLVLSSLTAPSYANDSVLCQRQPLIQPCRAKGMLTNAQGAMLDIDRTAYLCLAAIALVEDKFGTPLSFRISSAAMSNIGCSTGRRRIRAVIKSCS